jgi:hypothetical protein
LAKYRTFDEINETLAEIDKTGYDFGYINFDFGINSLNELELLNEYVFTKRQDLILHLSTNKNGYVITDDELKLVSKLNNIKKFCIYGTNNKNYGPLINMEHLILFETTHQKTLDINFIEKWIELKELMLWGKIKNIKSIKNCINIEKIHLHIPLNAEELYFLIEMENLKELWVETRKKDELGKLIKWFNENGKENIITEYSGC